MFHQPIISLDDDQIGAGYRRVAVGETVKTHFEVYLLMPQGHWALSSFFTDQGIKVTGRSHYREAVSLGARLRLVGPVLRKLWERWTRDISS